mmetsp:Transcript_679/g.2176  ORF Transcript_679/g.2176 Transcript_679/m.2176 type:complete len:281 (+) Transcript_679:265-1107(+)
MAGAKWPRGSDRSRGRAPRLLTCLCHDRPAIAETGAVLLLVQRGKHHRVCARAERGPHRLRWVDGLCGWEGEQRLLGRLLLVSEEPAQRLRRLDLGDEAHSDPEAALQGRLQRRAPAPQQVYEQRCLVVEAEIPEAHEAKQGLLLRVLGLPAAGLPRTWLVLVVDERRHEHLLLHLRYGGRVEQLHWVGPLAVRGTEPRDVDERVRVLARQLCRRFVAPLAQRVEVEDGEHALHAPREGVEGPREGGELLIDARGHPDAAEHQSATLCHEEGAARLAETV